MRWLIAAVTFALVLASPLGLAQAPQQEPSSPQQRAAMLKQWMQASQAQLRSYEWIETTVISVKGEEKSRQQKRCYYGADGQLQKVLENGGSAGESGPRGPLRKRAAESKKEELTAYMQSAVGLVQSYVPPQPTDIQAAIGAGKLGVQVVEPGRRVRLDFSDYKKPGDKLGVEIETTTNRLLGLSVASYLNAPADSVALNVTMSVLPDGTIFAQRTVLDAPAKALSVTVENSGYRRMGQ